MLVYNFINFVKLYCRFDPNTPHDVLQPLNSLKRLKELSTVCVSSGERCLLDFTDIAPLLEHHGPKSLQALEMKVQKCNNLYIER